MESCVKPEVVDLKEMEKLPYIIAVDFDGTLCGNAFPEIGQPKHDIINAAKAAQKNGAKLILWTCRNKDHLQNAVEWCRTHGLDFDAVNENLEHVKEMFGGDTRKIYANEYWDDKAYYIP